MTDNVPLASKSNTLSDFELAAINAFCYIIGNDLSKYVEKNRDDVIEAARTIQHIANYSQERLNAESVETIHASLETIMKDYRYVDFYEQMSEMAEAISMIIPDRRERK